MLFTINSRQYCFYGLVIFSYQLQQNYYRLGKILFIWEQLRILPNFQRQEFSRPDVSEVRFSVNTADIEMIFLQNVIQDHVFSTTFLDVMKMIPYGGTVLISWSSIDDSAKDGGPHFTQSMIGICPLATHSYQKFTTAT